MLYKVLKIIQFVRLLSVSCIGICSSRRGFDTRPSQDSLRFSLSLLFYEIDLLFPTCVSMFENLGKHGSTFPTIHYVAIVIDYRQM